MEERLSFFESGELPRKNLEVMQEAITEFEAEKLQFSLTSNERYQRIFFIVFL